MADGRRALERWHMPRMMRADARSRSPGPRTGGVKTYEDLAGELWAIESHVVPSIKRDFFVRGGGLRRGFRACSPANLWLSWWDGSGSRNGGAQRSHFLTPNRPPSLSWQNCTGPPVPQNLGRRLNRSKTLAPVLPGRRWVWSRSRRKRKSQASTRPVREEALRLRRGSDTSARAVGCGRWTS